MKTYILWAVVAVILVALLLWTLNWLLLPLRVLNPDEGLARWRWYHDTYNAILATDANIASAEDSLDTFIKTAGNPSDWNWQQNDEYQRLVAVRNGYIMQYHNLVARYNARMSDITRNWSAPANLPTHIEEK